MIQAASLARTDDAPCGAQLALYDAMCTAIAAAFEVDEIKTIREQARMYEAAAKIAGNTEAEDRCYQIRRRAERRLGELMAEQKKTVGSATGNQHTRPLGVPTTPSARPSLAEAGIDKNLAKDARALASVPETKFEAAFASGGRPSIAEITGKPKPQPTASAEAHAPKKPAERTADSTMALWLWGRVLDFERNGMLRADPATCVRVMEDFQIEDLRRVGPHVVAWLNQFLAAAKLGVAR